jgi:hypothetical protein
VKINGLSSTDNVPLELITPDLKARECRLDARKSARFAIDDDDDEAISHGHYAASSARMAQLHELLITEMRTVPKCSRRNVDTHTGIQETSPLFRIPREIRDMIWELVFEDNGKAYIVEQLLGLPKGKPYYLTPGLQPLLTCRQIYAEAFQIAYRHATIFHFPECEQRLLAVQQIYSGPYRIAVWVDPYTPRIIEKQLTALFDLKIQSLTVCSNFLAYPPTNEVINPWVKALIKLTTRMKVLEKLQFFTGCSLYRTKDRDGKRFDAKDGGFAQGLRQGWNSYAKDSRRVVDVSLNCFSDNATTTTFSTRSGTKIVLHIASIYEDAYNL